MAIGRGLVAILEAKEDRAAAGRAAARVDLTETADPAEAAGLAERLGGLEAAGGRTEADQVEADLVEAGQAAADQATGDQPEEGLEAEGLAADAPAEADPAATVAKFWKGYDALLADLDGVIYEGENAIPFAVETIAALQREGVSIGYVTNNSSRTQETIAKQLRGFGIEVSPEQVIGSAQTGVELLETLVSAPAKILVVGGEGLRHWVREAGYEIVSRADDGPAAVIQGFAPDVAWYHLAEASFAIQRGAKWVATNNDWTIPREGGIAPGNGTLVSAVHTAVGQLPVVAGKPEPAIFNTAVRVLAASSPLFVGDRLDTDITGANWAGIDSALVMTGVCTRKELLAAKPESRPKFLIENLSELLQGYSAAKETKRGYSFGKAEVELLGNRVMVTHGDPKSFAALKAACAVIWGSGQAIYALDVEPALYE